MAKITVKYEAIDPFESTHEQTFIGNTIEDCEEQMMEYERFLGRNHANGIASIFKVHIINESF